MSREKEPLHYRYTIDLDELGYAELMQLVMKYGTGEGGSTATTTRIALADAQVRLAEKTWEDS